MSTQEFERQDQQVIDLTNKHAAELNAQLQPAAARIERKWKRETLAKTVAAVLACVAVAAALVAVMLQPGLLIWLVNVGLLVCAVVAGIAIDRWWRE